MSTRHKCNISAPYGAHPTIGPCILLKPDDTWAVFYRAESPRSQQGMIIFFKKRSTLLVGEQVCVLKHGLAAHLIEEATSKVALCFYKKF